MTHLRRQAGRGQVIVIAAMLIAVLFVGLAIVVNSAIYTENLGTRSAADDNMCTGKMVQHELRTGIVEMVDVTNTEATTDHATLVDALESDLAAYAEELESYCSVRGFWVTTSLRSNRNGTRLRQTNESRDFTSREGAWNWTLSSDVPDGGQFAMSIQGTSLFEDDLSVTLATLQDEAFGVEFHVDGHSGDGNGAYRVFFYQGTLSDNVYAVVEHPDQDFSGLSTETVDGWLNQTCVARGDTVSVRYRQATYGGVPCGEFGFYEDLDAHEVAYTNARVHDGLGGYYIRARGGYDVLVDTTTYNTSAFHDVGDGQPFHQAAITRVTYDGTAVSDGRSMTVDGGTVVPHRYDRAGILRRHPEVDRFAVTDRSGSESDPTFDVDWRVTDDDSDLQRVELHLFHVADEVVADSVNHTVDGYRANGTDTLQDTRVSGDEGDDYRVIVTVVDADGRATTRTRRLTAG